MRDASSRLSRMRATIERESKILNCIARGLESQSASAVDLLLATRGHVLVAGAGTSQTIAQRFAHLLSCSGLPALFVHPGDSLHGSSGAVKASDTVVLISKGGSTAEVNEFGRIAKKLGAVVIALTGSRTSELIALADGVILVPLEPESDPFGMVATASSLASASICDAICETVMHEIGYRVEQFAATHPGGAVGERIRQEQILSQTGERIKSKELPL